MKKSLIFAAFATVAFSTPAMAKCPGGVDYHGTVRFCPDRSTMEIIGGEGAGGKGSYKMNSEGRVIKVRYPAHNNGEGGEWRAARGPAIVLKFKQ
jgi:hypothetical protein